MVFCRWGRPEFSTTSTRGSATVAGDGAYRAEEVGDGFEEVVDLFEGVLDAVEEGGCVPRAVVVGVRGGEYDAAAGCGEGEEQEAGEYNSGGASMAGHDWCGGAGAG